VTATVTNTGSRSGADVAQLYVTDPSASGQPPLQLEGFQRVTLAAGASATVTFPLTQQNLQFWNSSSNAWATSTGNYTVSVGDSSASLPLTGTLAVTSGQLGAPVTVANPGPQASLAGRAASTVTLSGKDATSGQTLAYSATGLPAGLSISSAGVISGTPTTNGTSTVTVTATDGNGASAAQSFVWTVSPGTASGTASPTGPITGYQGLCLDDRSASTALYNPIQVYTCNGTNAQQWTVESNGTLEVLGMCLDVAGAGTANGTLVDLYTCNGTGAQQWQAQSNGELVNPESGKCLDDTGFGGSGTQVQIWSCGDGTNQQWHLP
jgi:beta-glucosidase